MRIHRDRWIPLTKEQWSEDLMFALLLSWRRCWTDSPVAGDFRRYWSYMTSLQRCVYYITQMMQINPSLNLIEPTFALAPVIQIIPRFAFHASITPARLWNEIFWKYLSISPSYSQKMIRNYIMDSSSNLLFNANSHLQQNCYHELNKYLWRLWRYISKIWKITHKNKNQFDAYFEMNGLKILWEILKLPFEISCNILNLYTAKYAFHEVLKFDELHCLKSFMTSLRRSVQFRMSFICIPYVVTAPWGKT